MSQAFSVSADKYFAEPGVCVRLTVAGTLTSRASRSLGPLTRWRNIHVRDSTTSAEIRRASGPGPCDLSAEPVKADGFELSTGWEAGRFHDFINEDGEDGGDSFLDLGSGTRFEGRSDTYSASGDDLAISYHDVRRGSRLCLEGRAWYDIYTESPAEGAASDGGVLDLRPCLTR